jgi:hypothetical protein
MIKGLDKLQRDLDGLQKAFKELDGSLGTIEFDPHDPLSIEQAIAQVHRTIDDRVATYASNSLVRPVIAELKEKTRQDIIERASRKRLGEADK